MVNIWRWCGVGGRLWRLHLYDGTLYTPSPWNNWCRSAMGSAVHTYHLLVALLTSFYHRDAFVARITCLVTEERLELVIFHSVNNRSRVFGRFDHGCAEKVKSWVPVGYVAYVLLFSEQRYWVSATRTRVISPLAHIPTYWLDSFWSFNVWMKKYHFFNYFLFTHFSFSIFSME